MGDLKLPCQHMHKQGHCGKNLIGFLTTKQPRVTGSVNSKVAGACLPVFILCGARADHSSSLNILTRARAGHLSLTTHEHQPTLIWLKCARAHTHIGIPNG